MIAFLRGQLRGEDDEAIVIDVGGVGYQVLPSAATKAALLPGEVQLHIHAHFVTDEPLRLYGFSTTSERSLFRTLLSVQGVGPRVALAILAGIETEDLVRAIATGDVAALEAGEGGGGQARRAPGARAAREDPGGRGGRGREGGEGEGRRTLPRRRRARVPVGPLGEVYGALVLLGYKPVEIDPLIEKMDEKRPIADNVRGALAALRRG